MQDELKELYEDYKALLESWGVDSISEALNLEYQEEQMEEQFSLGFI